MIGFIKKMLGLNNDLASVVEQGAIILDVRTVGEYQQGHGKSSKNIPLQKIETKIETIRKWDKPVITCCASGMRSAGAAKILRSHGIEAHNGGSWQKADALTR
ncbi:MAG: rhodanese-like domain-containing protein [Bacteroidetes bacterium]|jgi:rhodanese-related sulfurtransferase|nr:rhodanese-like domain-containing protein [Bacteroidota bacterium]